MAFSSTVAFYINRCTENEYLNQLPEMKTAFNEAYEKMTAEYATCCAEASAANEYLMLLKLDNVVGPTMDKAVAASTAKDADVYMNNAMLNAVKAENDILNAFYIWVQWRYACAEGLEDKKAEKDKVKAEISRSIFRAGDLKRPEDILAFWKGEGQQPSMS
jgi:hypothetical protein